MLKQIVLLAGLGLLAAGCSYYQVTDTTTGQIYYTRQINSRPGGAIAFQDVQTGSNVTLQHPQVHKLTRDQYDTAVEASVPNVQPAAVKIPPIGSSSTGVE